MKTLVLFLPLLALTLGYTDLNDKFLENTMLTDKEKARKETLDFVECLLDEGPCNDFNAKAKPHVLQAMSDGCEECDETQKKGAIRFMKTMKSDFPELWLKFEKRYDPSKNFERDVQKLSAYA